MQSLVTAADEGDLEKVELLLNSGADVNYKVEDTLVSRTGHAQPLEALVHSNISTRKLQVCTRMRVPVSGLPFALFGFGGSVLVLCDE